MQENAIYCQYCGDDITLVGGEITTTRAVYCLGDNLGSICGMDASMNGDEPRLLVSQTHSPNNLQGAIISNMLVEYGPLEKKINKS